MPIELWLAARRLRNASIDTQWFHGEIIGIMRDLVDSSPATPARPQMFAPSSHPNYPAGTITIRARAPVASSVPQIRSLLEETWGPLPPARFGLMQDELARIISPFQARSTLLGLIAALCLPLAGVGLTGAVLFAVRSRRREVAIRVALGAEPRSVRSVVVAGALTSVALGLLVGIAIGAARDSSRTSCSACGRSTR